ncbi:MAG: tRNA uridine(34) 5-carboxymethylaminomethyl modification radical SAM/GNAT enzyme Elp3 [Thermoplasmata archaeon]|nr:MAG: tRNA uridine(34) 5-carboxymethylaminomethyl modification radical SAM/GNAT enzyme Elp3 [Thermoplasmata archaeon]
MDTKGGKQIKKIAKEILQGIKDGQIVSKEDVHEFKKYLGKKYRLSRIPTNAEILAHIGKQDAKVVKLLRKKPIRTISGVAVVAVMSSPYPCPHGRCLPCPGGPPFSSQSYTGKEPAAMRAIMYGYDPFLQTKKRIEQLHAIGHSVDKVEMIVMGGTFTSRDFWYQEWFVKRCYDALNGEESNSLQEAMQKNEKAKHRCIGLTIETRPDWCRLNHIDRMLSFGTTRVELGVQILDDCILYAIERGHTVSDIVDATRICKDAGLKVCYHIMPGLPHSTIKNDIDSFRAIFKDERFKPDMIKIYPTLVVKPSLLHEKWKKGKYAPLSTEKAIDIIAEMKRYVPPWVRIQRIERDIPAPLIEEGIKKSNLRQLVLKKMKENGWDCKCIRCREVGHRSYKDKIFPEKIELVRREYKASGGKEIFLSIEDRKNDILIGYCRLRFPFAPHRYEISKKDAIIRELKVSGVSLPLKREPDEEWQHRGFGKKLISEAEKIAKKNGCKKLLILSGIGVKEYYRSLGYKNDGIYVSKRLD